MRDFEIELARGNIKNKLPDIIQSFGLDKARFSPSVGGEFSCPACGHTVKAYVNARGTWAINPLGNCSHFDRGAYSPDTIGLYALATNQREGDAYKELMAKEGVYLGSKSGKQTDPAIFERIKEQNKIREAENKKRLAEREAVKQANGRKVIEATSWGLEMPQIGFDLLYSRGIDILSLPLDLQKNVGYVKVDGLKSLDTVTTYSIEGIAFRLGEDAVQVRRTQGDKFIGKDSKLARFQTFGVAIPFAMDCVKKRRGEPVFIVEGPFDALALYMAGAKSVVATMGAGNHEYIVAGLNAVTDKSFVCYDTDAVGRRQGDELVKALRATGVRSMYYSIAGREHDANDLLQKDPRALALRIDYAKAIALDGLDNDTIREAIKILGSADIIGDDKHLTGEVKKMQYIAKLRGVQDVATTV